MQDYAKRLSKTTWRTSSARFNASRRLKRFAFSSTVASVALAIVSIGAAIFLSVSNGASYSHAQIGAIITLASVTNLAVGLVAYNLGYEVRAHKLHESAERINDISNRLDILLAEKKGTDFQQRVESLREEYEATRKATGDNHEPVDDLLFRLDHPDAFSGVKAKKWVAIVRGYGPTLAFHWVPTLVFAVWLVSMFVGLAGRIG